MHLCLTLRMRDVLYWRKVKAVCRRLDLDFGLDPRRTVALLLQGRTLSEKMYRILKSYSLLTLYIFLKVKYICNVILYENAVLLNIEC